MVTRLPEIKAIYNRLKASAKRRGIFFNLSLNDLNDLTFPITCPVFGIKLEFNRGSVQDNSYSIDRIDNSKGYEADNIEVVSYKANKLKSTLNINDLDKIKEYINNHEI